MCNQCQHVGSGDWGNHWGKGKEETLFSISRQHFRHYKAVLQLAYVSHLQARIATLTIWRGIVLDRWSQGLSVIFGEDLWLLPHHKIAINSSYGGGF